ncbi:MAG: dihydroneopterin aldolase [Bradymonadaceae bacterium]
MKIFVENLKFVGHHGVYDEEQREGRQFRADLTVELEEPPAVDTDDIEDTVDYRGLADTLLEVGRGPSCHLIEHLGDRMLTHLFERFPRIRRASLTLRKFATGVPGAPESVGLTMERTRSGDADNQ